MKDSERWIKVVDPFHPRRLAFRFDPERDVIELARGGERREIDLSRLRRLERKDLDEGNICRQ